MFYKNEDYIARTDLIDGQEKYFIKYLGQVNEPEVEVSADVFKLYLTDFAQPLKKHKNESSRHFDLREFDVVAESKEVSGIVSDIEEQCLAKAEIEEALKTCTPTQKRRFELYYSQGYSFEEIAKNENCSKQSVQESINAALKKFKIFF